MLRLSPQTVASIALHAADQTWCVFVQLNTPSGPGPVKAETIKGTQLGPRIRTLVADNPYDAFLIGMIPTTVPFDAGMAFANDYPTAHIRDGWFEPSPEIMAYIETNGTEAIQQLLELTHPAGLEGTDAVSIDVIAEMLDVSVPTVRRMVQRDQIPYLRWGKTLRFVPNDVIASLRR